MFFISSVKLHLLSIFKIICTFVSDTLGRKDIKRFSSVMIAISKWKINWNLDFLFEELQNEENTFNQITIEATKKLKFGTLIYIYMLNLAPNLLLWKLTKSLKFSESEVIESWKRFYFFLRFYLFFFLNLFTDAF